MALLEEQFFPPGPMELSTEEHGIAESIKEQFWLWFWQNHTDVVLSRRVLLWRVHITLGELRPLFEKIFGPGTRV